MSKKTYLYEEFIFIFIYLFMYVFIYLFIHLFIFVNKKKITWKKIWDDSESSWFFSPNFSATGLKDCMFLSCHVRASEWIETV